jgi:hypothetical protein
MDLVGDQRTIAVIHWALGRPRLRHSVNCDTRFGFLFEAFKAIRSGFTLPISLPTPFKSPSEAVVMARFGRSPDSALESELSA